MPLNKRIHHNVSSVAKDDSLTEAQFSSTSRAAIFISFGIACQCYFVFGISYIGTSLWFISSGALWVLREKLQTSAFCFGTTSLAYGGLGMALAHRLLSSSNMANSNNGESHHHMHHENSADAAQATLIIFNSSALLHYALMIFFCLGACIICNSIQKNHWSTQGCYWRHHLISVPWMLMGMFWGTKIFIALCYFLADRLLALHNHIMFMQQSTISMHFAATLGMCFGTACCYFWLDLKFIKRIRQLGSE